MRTLRALVAGGFWIGLLVWCVGLVAPLPAAARDAATPGTESGVSDRGMGLAAEVRVAQAAPPPKEGGGILKVYSNPSGARIFINDEEVGKTSMVRLLPPGPYRLKLMLEGYETYEERIEIPVNKRVTINATLTRIVGSLELLVNVDGAEVLLDDKKVGMTPNVLVEDLPSGVYQIQIRKPGYSPYVGPITVKPNVRLKLRVTLDPNAAIVTVNSKPTGAEVFLDGKSVGKTPLTLETVEAGRRALKVVQPGYASHYRAFQAGVGERLELNVTLQQPAGGLSVKTDQPGADVFLEGNLLGKTPLLLEKEIQAGQYSLRIARAGYADHIQPISIEAGKKARVKTSLISLEEARKSGGVEHVRDTRMGVPLTKRWWFWTLVGGAVAAAAGGTTAALIQPEPAVPTGDVVVSLP